MGRMEEISMLGILHFINVYTYSLKFIPISLLYLTLLNLNILILQDEA